MAIRGYVPVYDSFQYDFDRDGGSQGFIALGGIMKQGYTPIQANVHVILKVNGGNISIRGSVDVPQMTDSLSPAELQTGTHIAFGHVNDRPFSTVDQIFGINIGSANITQGKFVIFLIGTVITET